MWPLQRINTAPRSPRSRSFSCSSFKDIQSLCLDDDVDVDRRTWPPDSLRSSPSVFHRVRTSASSFASALRDDNSLPTASKPITVYFTSLRVVRKTFEDCRAVRSILLGYCVPIDERDLYMDSSYVTELQEILGGRKGKEKGKGFAIPCVFVGRCYVGGADELKRLHDSGELRAMIAVGPSPCTAAECGVCGGLRYVACGQSDVGSKIYVDKSGFMICKASNDNGLARGMGL